jgi:hypothetical protein
MAGPKGGGSSGNSGGSSGNSGGSSSGQSNGSNSGNGNNSGSNNGSDNGTSTNNGQTGTNEPNVVLGGNYKNEPEPDGKPPEGYHREVTYSDNGVHSRESYSNGDVSLESNASAYAENGTAHAGFEAEVAYGSVSSTSSAYVQADAHFDDINSILAGNGKVQLGAEAQAKQEVSVDLGGADLSVNANARAAAGATLSRGKTQIGAEIGVGAEAKLGTGGNELTLGVGAGIGGGAEIIHGEDSDGDGQEEIGFSLSLKGGLGFNIGFKFEPEAVWNGAKDLLGLGEKSPEERLCGCIEQFEAVLEMKQANEAYDRLQSLL